MVISNLGVNVGSPLVFSLELIRTGFRIYPAKAWVRLPPRHGYACGVWGRKRGTQTYSEWDTRGVIFAGIDVFGLGASTTLSRFEPAFPDEQMIMGVYATLGIFLILASRNPTEHRSLIWFTVWSSVVHAGIMAVQAVLDPTERANLLGDVPALFIVAGVLALLMPRRQSRPM